MLLPRDPRLNMTITRTVSVYYYSINKLIPFEIKNWQFLDFSDTCGLRPNFVLNFEVPSEFIGYDE